FARVEILTSRSVALLRMTRTQCALWYDAESTARRIAWQAPTSAFSLSEGAAKKKLSKRNGVFWGAAPSPAIFLKKD
ncbi:MAG: hypothetical protein IJY22_08210, partial [Clostridia bacterium]|nr:hypothetical protein [Clostridia bacterium]